MKQLTYMSTAQTHDQLLESRDFLKNSYFSIHAFLAAGPSAVLGITVLFLLSGSLLKRGTLFPGLLVVTAGSVWITMLAAGRQTNMNSHLSSP